MNREFACLDWTMLITVTWHSNFVLVGFYLLCLTQSFRSQLALKYLISLFIIICFEQLNDVEPHTVVLFLSYHHT